MSKRAEELARNLLESFASQPEILPQSPENVTWDTPGVGSIDIEEFAQRIVAALHEYGKEVRRRDVEVCNEQEGLHQSTDQKAAIRFVGYAISREELP